MAFADIIGHKKQAAILKALIRHNRLPSSILLRGQTGIGKRLMATNFAKAINCLNPMDYDCCDTCNSCRKINSRLHPDVFSLEQDDNEIMIEQIRGLEEFIFIKPNEAKKRVVIVDNAQRMNINAQNAFLKTLEEPPKNCILILITSSPDMMLDTIKSRCFQIRFNPLPKEDFNTLISKGHLKDSDLIALCSGCPGPIFSGDMKAKVESFHTNLEDMYKGEVKERWKDSREMQAWLNLALVYIRDRLIHTIMGPKAQLMISSPQSKTVDVQKAMEAYERLLSICLMLDSNLNKKIVWNLSKEIISPLGEV